MVLVVYANKPIKVKEEMPKMARKINAAPKGYHTATPVLVVHNAVDAVDFYTAVFGAKELSRLTSDDGLTILRAEMKIGNSVVHLNDELPGLGILSPLAMGGTSTAVQLYLPDVDAVWAKAVAANVLVVMPMEDTYWGERTGKIIDPFGHVWILSQRIESLSKAEIAKRAAAQALPVEETTKDPVQTIDIGEALTADTGEKAVATAAQEFDLAAQTADLR
jgi:PhnB protein